MKESVAFLPLVMYTIQWHFPITVVWLSYQENDMFIFLFCSCSLEELSVYPETDNVVLAFKQLAREYGEKFKEAFKYEA